MSPALGAGNFGEPRPISRVGILREVVCG